jgi:cyanophycinase
MHVSAHVDNYQTATDVTTLDGKTNQELLLQADIVFFNGGDQSKHSRTWLTDNGECGAILCQLLERYRRGAVVFTGTSAGTAIMSNPTYGEGIPFGHAYFASKVGLASKKVSDGAVGGSGLSDTRNGTSGLQYSDNGGYIPGFPGVNSSFVTDTHFDARGRLTRLIPALKSLQRKYGIAVD